MSKPRLLDLFCGAGGCTKGYQRAGFYVVGVDIKPQPHYCGDEFYLFDALRLSPTPRASGGICFHAEWRCVGVFDAVHASPPCQKYSALAAMHPERDWPDLIPPTRDLLRSTELPWVMENVEGAPLAHRPQLDGTEGIVLCGSMFGLQVEKGQLRRHRAFETSFPVAQPQCAHRGSAVGVYGHGGHSGKHRMLYRKDAGDILQIDWMNRDELAQAIPPAYTQFIGEQLLQHLGR